MSDRNWHYDRDLREWIRISDEPAPPEPVMALSRPVRFPAPQSVTLLHAVQDSVEAPLETLWMLWTHVPPIVATCLVSPALAYASACMYDRGHSEHIRDLWTLPTRAWEGVWEYARQKVTGWL